MLKSIFLSSITIITILLLIFIENTAYCLLFFLLIILFNSLLLILLNIEFIALIFLLVYIGAIAILFIFALIFLKLNFKSFINFIKLDNILIYFLILIKLFIIIFWLNLNIELDNMLNSNYNITDLNIFIQYVFYLLNKYINEYSLKYNLIKTKYALIMNF